MKLQNIDTKPRVQIPIRIDHELNERFTEISDSTLIPRSKLTRIGLELLFRNIETRGITSVLKELEEV
jgi:hypothetical protein